MVSLRRPDITYLAQHRIHVAERQFRAGPFSKDGASLKPGRYQVVVSSPLSDLQPASVRTLIGQRGAALQGPLTTILLGERVVQFTQMVAVGSPSPVPKEAAPKAKSAHASWAQSCKRKCTLFQASADQRGQSFDWSQCYLLCLTEEPRKPR